MNDMSINTMNPGQLTEARRHLDSEAIPEFDLIKKDIHRLERERYYYQALQQEHQAHLKAIGAQQDRNRMLKALGMPEEPVAMPNPLSLASAEMAAQQIRDAERGIALHESRIRVLTAEAAARKAARNVEQMDGLRVKPSVGT